MPQDADSTQAGPAETCPAQTWCTAGIDRAARMVRTGWSVQSLRRRSPQIEAHTNCLPAKLGTGAGGRGRTQVKQLHLRSQETSGSKTAPWHGRGRNAAFREPYHPHQMQSVQAALHSMVAFDLKATIPLQASVGNACLDHHMPAIYNWSSQRLECQNGAGAPTVLGAVQYLLRGSLR